MYLWILVLKTVVLNIERHLALGLLLKSSFSYWMHPNVWRWPCGPPTRLPVMIAFNSTAVHNGPSLSGIFSSSQRLAPIHSANLVGSHRCTARPGVMYGMRTWCTPLQDPNCHPEQHWRTCLEGWRTKHQLSLFKMLSKCAHFQWWHLLHLCPGQAKVRPAHNEKSDIVHDSIPNIVYDIE